VDITTTDQPMVFGGADSFWVSRELIGPLSMRITLDGRTTGEAGLSALRGRVGEAASDYSLTYEDGSFWAGSFIIDSIHESAPEAQERTFMVRLLSDGRPIYTVA